MNTFRITTISLATTALLAGCNEYELEGSAFKAFKTAYGQNFINNVGDIDPNQSWDFSTAGGNRGKAAETRAVHLNDDGWYYPEEQTLDWMHDKLKEQRDNSSLCKDFYLSWTPGMSFQIVPIWEGYAKMKWKLFMKVTSAEGGTTLYDQEIWSKGKNVEINGSVKTDWDYDNNEICVWFEYFGSNGNVLIWPYSTSHDGSYYTGQAWATTSMQKIGDRNGHQVYKWTCKQPGVTIDDLPTKVQFIIDKDGNKTKVNKDGIEDFTFRNHGYYYNDNPSYADHDGGKTDSPVSLYTPSDPTWRAFGNLDDAAKADGFRAKPITITDPNAGTSDAWPLGSIVSFYLKITGDAIPTCANVGDMMSTLNKQIAFLNVPESAMPGNVDKGEGVVTGIMGCEDSHIDWDGSDKDYNDVVFLINGVMPEPVVIDKNPSASSVPVEKRYMAEDLTNTGDMDFNDIVVDVKSVRWTYWRVNTTTNEKEVHIGYNETLNIDGQTLTFKNGICDVQTATVKHLCGTIPIRFKVGDTMLPWITNPTVLEQSKAQLNGTFSGTPSYGTGSESTQGIDPEVTLSVTGWDPKTNNVFVYAGWDATNSKATKPTTEGTDAIVSGSDWCSAFPLPGTVPCIIATDVTDQWTPECVDINNTGWWKTNFISTEH